MHGRTNLKLLAAFVMLNEQVDQIHQLSVLTMWQKQLPRALEIYTLYKSRVANLAANCMVYSMQMSSNEMVLVLAVADVESPGSQSSYSIFKRSYRMDLLQKLLFLMMPPFKYLER